MDKTEDLNELVLGKGWHNLEGNESLSWRWSSDLSYLQINCDQYDSISIEAYENIFDINCKIYTRLKNNEIFNLYQYITVKKNNKLFVKIPINNVIEVKFETDTFVPSELDKKSNDSRKLGLRIGGFTFWKEDKSKFIHMSDVLNYKDDVSYKKIIIC